MDVKLIKSQRYRYLGIINGLVPEGLVTTLFCRFAKHEGFPCIFAKNRFSVLEKQRCVRLTFCFFAADTVFFEFSINRCHVHPCFCGSRFDIACVFSQQTGQVVCFKLPQGG